MKEITTRQDAIDALCSAWYHRDLKFHLKRQEIMDSAEALFNSLQILGVTYEEIQEAADEISEAQSGA